MQNKLLVFAAAILCLMGCSPQNRSTSSESDEMDPKRLVFYEIQLSGDGSERAWEEEITDEVIIDRIVTLFGPEYLIEETMPNPDGGGPLCIDYYQGETVITYACRPRSGYIFEGRSPVAVIINGDWEQYCWSEETTMEMVHLLEELNIIYHRQS